MRWTRSLSTVAIGLALTWSAARAQGPASWPGTAMPSGGPVTPAAYPCPPAGYPDQGPPAPPAVPDYHVLPSQPAEPAVSPGTAQQTAPIHPATQFPTGTYHDLNGVSEGGNSFSCQTETDCHPCLIANFEYLGWWPRRIHGQELITTGTDREPVPGAVGDPRTLPVLGGELSPDRMDGGRFSLEYLFPNPIDCCNGCYLFGHSQYLSVEGNVFGVSEEQSYLFASDPRGNPVLSRPFFNADKHLEDADPISLPRVMAGAAEVDVATKLYGGEANVCVTQYGGGETGSRVGLLVGARYLDLDQGVVVTTASHDLGPAPLGSNFVTDQYGVHNKFWGGQVGAKVQFYWWDRVDLTVVGKVAVGPNQEELRIGGTTLVTNPNGFAGDRGLFTGPFNVGRYTNNEVVVVPEATVTLGFRVCDNVRLYAGYNYLYISDALQPGQAMDRVVSVPAVAAHGGGGPTFGTTGRPSLNPTSTDFWVQGVVAGVELSY
jgi:hypothetical protein